MRKLSSCLLIVFFCILGNSTVEAQTSQLDSLLSALETSSSQAYTVEILLGISAEYLQSNPDTSVALAQQAAAISHKINSPVLIIKSETQLGQALIRTASYTAALESLQSLLSYIETLEPEKYALERAKVVRRIGTIYFIQFQQEKALEFYTEVEPVFLAHNDSMGLFALYDNIASAYLETNREQEAEDYYLKSLSIILEIGSEQKIASSYVNLAILYNHLSRFEEAEKYAVLSLEIAERNNAQIMKTYALRILGSIAFDEHRFEDAIEFNLQSLEIANALDLAYEQKDSYLNLSEIYKEMGDFENAYYHYVLHKEYYDTLQNEQSNTRLAELRTKYEVDKIEQEKMLLLQQNELKSARIVAISSLMGLVLVLMVFGVIWFSTKKRKEIELLEKDRIIADSQKKLAEEELAIVRFREENLQKELTNFALHIVEKNDFLEEVKTEMADLRTDVKSDIAIKQINRLGNRIYQNLMLNKDREEFEIQVEHACTGFFKKLEVVHPELTNQDRRLAALLRLNLTSKEISGILNISPKSVDQSRYRLRKKLALDKEINLAHYLNQI